ncbi:stage V sporulation protein AB [Paenibacillus alginolyticus]|uniref:Stage V sporulation protein AB n=1 Tax=Paenibacillus alginolyticus TaxID=59839 RepID=A0ABT4GDA2_9BACL|nr:stage V sporulation protein AB [Paenibacillus alginolyticus]MCY9664771.1 stage V sporulation protein AB [Paenibacillus alginolyticus]MCY9694089.1 stage V sporulation protein AB [Paenibacillus alginolyticus]MEC0143547.1 stage V sporulation protein AB [Paenibacillus alginolyticus]
MTQFGEAFLAAFIGLAGGIAVGSGMVAFLVVLDIIPRLAQITRSFSKIHAYEAAVVLGSLLFTWVDFSDAKVHLFPMGAAVVGIFAGCFVGMLAAALTEIINVLPILAKRVGMGSYMILLLMAMIFGKVVGSLFEWLFY